MNASLSLSSYITSIILMADTKTTTTTPDTVSIKDSVLLDTQPSKASSVTITTAEIKDPRLKDEMYDSKLEWTEKEENEVRRILDIRLMPFILLMSFVLNMDRTNICTCSLGLYWSSY